MTDIKFINKYVVKSYEADFHGFLRLLTLMNLLQDMAVVGAARAGFGFEQCAQNGLTWFGSDYVVEIKRLPKMGEAIEIATWPVENKWGAIRDFVMTDANGEPIVRASSRWALIDLQRLRPVPLKKYFPQYLALEERALPVEFNKLPEPESFERADEVNVRFDDIDINQHVNNAVYVLWASEGVDVEYRKTHVPCGVEINFKKAVKLGEDVVVRTHMDGDESIHSIIKKDDEAELVRCRIKWQKITSE